MSPITRHRVVPYLATLLSLVKSLALGRQPAHCFRWMEPWPLALVAPELFQHIRQTEPIRPAQQATPERREADAQDQAHIHIARIANDAFRQYAARFDHHGQEEPIANLLGADVTVGGTPFLQNRLQGRVIGS